METRETIGMAALVVVIIGVILNFGSAQLHHRFSASSQEAVRDADRREAIQQAEAQQARLLDQLVAKSMKEKLTEMAPDLADEQATRLAAKFYQREEAKHEKPKGVSGAIRVDLPDEPGQKVDVVSMAHQEEVFNPEPPEKPQPEIRSRKIRARRVVNSSGKQRGT